MTTLKFLLAGESWISSSTHFKGWDFFSSTLYETGIEYLENVFHNTDIEFIHMPSHIASKEFPSSINAMKAFDVIALSDIGANTLLLPPETDCRLGSQWWWTTHVRRVFFFRWNIRSC